MISRRSYGKNFKEEAVKLAVDTNVNEAARSLGISEYTLRNWVTNAKYRSDNPFIGSGHKYILPHDAEKFALQKEIKEL